MQPQPGYPPMGTAYPPGVMPPVPGYPPPGYPPVPGAYAAPAQTAPPAQYAAPAAPGTMPGGDSFASPTRVVNVVRPRIMDFGVGRLLLIKPTKIERQVPAPTSAGEPVKLQDRLTADVVALDGPPFAYGGKPERDGTPHTHTATPPEEWPGLWLTQDLLVRQCEKMVGGMVLGRLVRGQASDPKRNAPWRLDEPTEEDRVIARQYLAGAAIAAATPSPVTPPPAPANPAGYPPTGGVPTMAQHTVPQPPAPPVWNPATGSWDFPGQPAPAPAAAAQAYLSDPNPGAQYNPGSPPGAPYGATQPAAYPPPPMAPPALDINTPPPGFDPNVWQTLNVEQRTAIAASTAARPPWQ